MPPDAPISITLSPGLLALMRRGPAPLVHEAVRKALDRENELTVGQTVRDRMSFPRGIPSTMEGLRVQTGHLRRSLTRSRAVVGSQGVSSAIGSNVRYFGPHEFGFEGRVTVRQHQRRLPDRYLLTSGQTIDLATAGRAGFLTRKGKLRSGLGEKLPERYVMVAQHERNVRLPARRMVQRTVIARMPAYAASIAREIRAALGSSSATA